MRVVITGATGVVGRNLLFEFLKNSLADLGSLELIILGRSHEHASLARRVTGAILADGLPYVSPDGGAEHRIRDYCESGIRCIEIDLDQDGLSLTQKDLAYLKASPVDFFFHAAALTDLRSSGAVARAIHRTNVGGTLKILELVSRLNVRQFCYLGSAYCCGEATGLMRPDDVSMDREFRNPYEAAKMEAEIEVRRFAARTGVRCRYFRPSIVCGRLMELPLGAISKFGTFYAPAAFLLRAKLAALPAGADPYGAPTRLDLRACGNPYGSLNLVPADYAAKVMYQVCMQDDPGESYHVVNPIPTPNGVFVAQLPRVLNVRGLKLVDRTPKDPNRLEALYYKTVGAWMNRYVLSDRVAFDMESVSRALQNAGLRCPLVDSDGFRVLMDYAKKHYFGLNYKPVGGGQAHAAAAA
jgi:nucleoside-diphosphate-sugar epimerase